MILALDGFTLLLFNSGQLRIMGKLTLNHAQEFLNSIHNIYTCIETPLNCTTQTFVFQIDKTLVPINLHNLSNRFGENCNFSFLPELFPAFSIKLWKPVHVNLFSTGKVVVLGKQSCTLLSSIQEWVYFNVILYA